MKSLLRIPLAACLAISFSGMAQAVTDEKTVPLARTAKEGDIARYKATINANVLGMDVIVTRKYKITVKEIRKSGEIVTVQKDEGTTLSFGGAEQPPQDPTPDITEVRDKLGKLIETKLPEAMGVFTPEVQLLMARTSEPLFTDKPVKKDDTWQIELENPVVKGKKVTIKATYLGSDKVDGKDLWKVKQSMEADTNSEAKKVSGEFTAWLDPDKGSTVKAEGSMKDLPISVNGAEMLMSYTMKIETVKGDK
jgi:hypothetical protein